MVSYVVSDNLPRNQYVAAAAQTVFTYDFVISKASDILVYQTPSGQTGNDAADILILDVHYNVTGVGISGGGTVVLVSGAAALDRITLQRDAPVERTSNFKPGGFTADEINNDLNKEIIFTQDNEMRISELSIRYQDASIVDKSRDVHLPILDAEEFWQMNATGTGITKAKLEPNADVNTLRSELASQGVGSDGSRIVGFESAAAGSITAHDQLVKVDTFGGQIATNTANIATNTANIATNTSNITTNATNITANTNAIAGLEIAESDTNLIIGGNFSTNPFQRLTTATGSGDIYVADRFEMIQDGAVTGNTCAKITDAPSFGVANYHTQHSLGLTVVNAIASPATNDFFGYRYIIEGFDFAEIFESTAVLQFYVKSSTVGIHSIGFQNFDSGRFLVKEYTISVANTWEKVTISIPTIANVGNWNIDNGSGLRVFFSMASGPDISTSTLDAWTTSGTSIISSTNQVNGVASAANIFRIALVSITPGDIIPSTFPYRSVEQEISLCQRYYEQSYNFGQLRAATEVGQAITEVHNGTANNRHISLTIPYKTVKRATPTVNVANRSGTLGQWEETTWSPQAPAAGPVTLRDGNTAGFSLSEIGAAWLINNAIIGGHWWAQAELT